MAWMIILSTILLGAGGLGVFPSMAHGRSYFQTDMYGVFIEAEGADLTMEERTEFDSDSLKYLVRRDSSGPPGESHSGRSSSSPAEGLSESTRKSAVPSSLSEPEADLPVLEKRLDIPKEITVTPPQTDRDPLEGPGKSHSVIKKRGGVGK